MLVHSVGELAVEVGTGAGPQATHINTGTAKIWIRAKGVSSSTLKIRGYLFIVLPPPRTRKSTILEHPIRNWKFKAPVILH